MPGQKPFRGKWLKGVQDSNLLIYMIDVANQVRFNEAKEEMWAMLNEDDLIGIPLIILGNKVDLIEPSKDYDNCEQFARIRKEIHEFFELDRIRDRDWKFIFTSVKTNYMIDKLVKSIFVLTFE
jgi:ADP-ribosylation factor-like protein 8